MSDISDEENDNDNTIDGIYGNHENDNEEDEERNEEDEDEDEDEDEEIPDGAVDDEDDAMFGGAGSEDEDDNDDDEDEDEDDEEPQQAKLSSKKSKTITSVDSDEDEDDYEEKFLQKFDSEINKNYVYNYHPECVIHNYDEIAALTKIVRDSDNIIIDPFHRTLPFLTKYERARILGQRAKQIEAGAKPFVSVPENIIDANLIAELELQQKKIPFIIRRPLPSGAFEYWNIKDLEVISF